MTDEEYLASLPASTRAYIPTGGVAEYRDRIAREAAEAAAKTPIDRSGDDVSDMRERIYNLPSGTSKTVYYTLRAGVSRAQMHVYGYAGTQLLWVEDSYGEWDISGTNGKRLADLPILPGKRAYTFTCKSIGDNVAVQLEQS